MDSEAKTGRFSTKIQLMTAIIAILSLLIAFFGANSQNISIFLSNVMFPKPDFSIGSVANSSLLPSGFESSLYTSPEYYYVTSISLKTDTPYIGDAFQFGISFQNSGKKTVEQPRIVIHFVDFMRREWCVWNKSDAGGILTNGCNLEYRFPALDQKVIGAWAVFVLLYDDTQSVLVSYETKQFALTDNTPSIWTQITVTFTIIVLVIFLIYLIFTRARVKKSSTLTKREGRSLAETMRKRRKRTQDGN